MTDDLCSYPVEASSKVEVGAPSSTSKGFKESGDGKLLMGHVSLVTTFLLTPDEKFIITADRDEHIRISWYPESFVIERYCLGHMKYEFICFAVTPEIVEFKFLLFQVRVSYTYSRLGFIHPHIWWRRSRSEGLELDGRKGRSRNPNFARCYADD